jgi:hypothetical protein
MIETLRRFSLLLLLLRVGCNAIVERLDHSLALGLDKRDEAVRLLPRLSTALCVQPRQGAQQTVVLTSSLNLASLIEPRLMSTLRQAPQTPA